ncbi:diacylglycerol kinase family lipid kinase [Tianweitania sp. BSSL-BM11]|uniref:Diacylglycerol kinase family lipid kinase n=1 Tax=Tianweitania aestuarii TaxID=2814886 RepID=A0ABS5S1X3_9HYPH|nr:diacylglycerol kinase family protein [Tianweitania aestuarii]MBS9722521.1 diacylglycerol kinase family lipid kinase [Tianweitania aestuarii]
MHFLAVLNRDGGTLRTTDLDAFAERSRAALEKEGHTLEVEIVSGKDIVPALKKASQQGSVDVVIAGGGDGTISAAAACLMNSDTALAVLPAGTMNLFARSLQIPMGLDAAMTAFATGQVRAVDLATANGKPFVHQFSLGLHAKLVDLRDKMEYASRLGKMRASMRAAFLTVFQPPRVNITIKTDQAEIVARTTGIGITNNLFGEGHLPYADRLDQGVLGVYLTTAQTSREIVSFLVNLARGRWKNNARVEIHETTALTMTVRGRRRKPYRCVIDGESGDLARETVIKIHPGALKVLTPAQ